MNFTRFNEWLQVREMATATSSTPQVGAPGVADDPRVAAKNAQKIQLATSKYQLDLKKLAKDPMASKQMQQKIMGDPQLGPDVAAQIFKSL